MSLEPGGYGVYQHLVALAAGAAGAINVNGVNSGMAALKTDTAAMGRAKDADTSAVTHADAANAHDVSSNGTVDRSVAVGSAVPERGARGDAAHHSKGSCRRSRSQWHGSQ